VSLFVDTSIWYAAVDETDPGNERAQRILTTEGDLVLTDHVLVETWNLVKARIHPAAAEGFWEGVRSGAATLHPVTLADLEVAWAIGRDYEDQGFSLVDRTSLAVMQRLGITRVASFDTDFAVYRYGRDRRRAFEVLR